MRNTHRLIRNATVLKMALNEVVVNGQVNAMLCWVDGCDADKRANWTGRSVDVLV